MILMLLVTRLGRKLLMDGDCVSSVYTLLLCLVWFASAAIGAYVCFSMSPLAPYGTIAFPFILAVISVIVVLRNVVQLPGQQSWSATAGISLMIVGATVATLYVRHAFTF
jgi:hypothetical protein